MDRAARSNRDAAWSSGHAAARRGHRDAAWSSGHAAARRGHRDAALRIERRSAGWQRRLVVTMVAHDDIGGAMVAHYGGLLTVITYRRCAHLRSRIESLVFGDHNRGADDGERAHSAHSARSALGESFTGIESDSGQRRDCDAGEHAG